MTLLGFSLVFAAACAHAIWNFQVKSLNGGPELIWLFSAISVLVYAPFAAYVGWHWGGVSWWGVGFMFGSAILHLCYFLWLQHSYKQGDLSVIYPTARATGPVLSTIAAALLLGQIMPPLAALGGAIIVFGVMMLTGARFGQGSYRSLGYGLSIGVMIACYTIWDAYAVTVLLVPPLLMDYGTGLGRSILLAPYAWKHWDRVLYFWRNHPWAVLVIAVFNALAYILVLYALTFTPVIYVAPMREVSVLIAVFLGTWLLGEGHLRQRMTWAAVILAGVGILAIA